MSLRSSLGRRILTVCAAVFAALVVFAGPASAHAELVTATPSQGAVVGGEPTQVGLRFSEEIVLKLSAVKVIGPDGRRLDAGTLRAGPTGADSLAVDLAPDARHGTFVVVWQVTAADDGHASSGTVMFAVGAASVPASVAGLGHNRLTSATYDAGQWIGFAGLAMVGGVAALHTYRRREDGDKTTGSPAAEHTTANPTSNSSAQASLTADLRAAQADLAANARATQASLTTEDIAAGPAVSSGAGQLSEKVATAEPAPEPVPQAPSATPTWPAAFGWSLLLIGTLVQLTAYAPAARGLSLSHLLDRSLLSVTLGTREGHAFMARLVVLAVAAVVGDAVLRRAKGPVLPLAFTVAVAATWGATGHAATGGGAPVAMVALTLHVAAMAVWVGGLFVMAVLLTGGGAAVAAAVRRFSRLALGAVGVLVATGLYQAWREVGSVSALLDTTYGRLLLAKVAVLLCVIAVARGSRGIVATWHGGSEAALRRNVVVELAGASVLLLLAVLLAGNAPAR
ncbi:copper resistance CopC/CopD family protein [Catenulispora rubra]|uniref:copper resistance CopC/CopD family protein n=1 Tax=Catenulispora rubra TaxID=280293 RepID=UPI001891F83E|nr:copper resistance protein CopC [Catenulispora rubra]